MARRLLIFAAVMAVVCQLGCAGTWDAVSSRKFREDPFRSMFTSEEPITVLRNKVEGDARVDAMRRLKEPAKNGKSQAEQDEALGYLYAAATTDPSPVVRAAGIDALGRFDDSRTVTLLKDAYEAAAGVPSDPARLANTADLQHAANIESMIMLAPTGSEPSHVKMLRQRTVEAMSSKPTPEAVAFLAKVATTEPSANADQEVDRDVRSAATRGLGKMRSKESVTALASVLKQEAGRDVVLASTAHEGLVELTGKDLPADPDQWSKVVQAGVPLAPKPASLVEQVGLKK